MKLVEATNKHGRISNNWQDVSVEEMKLFIGLLILSGVCRSNHESVRSLWSHEFGRPIFRDAMSINRFETLCCSLRFDDKTTRSQRQERDKFCAIREIFEIFARQLPKYFRPSDSVTIDEQLMAFRGRCSFKQYMPMKPAKYGIKFFIMACSETSYALAIKPYLGKVGNKVAKNLAHGVVDELVRSIEGT